MVAPRVSLSASLDVEWACNKGGSTTGPTAQAYLIPLKMKYKPFLEADVSLGQSTPGAKRVLSNSSHPFLTLPHLSVGLQSSPSSPPRLLALAVAARK